MGKGESTGALSGGTEDLSDDDQHDVQELKNRDREVRAHEQAHMAADGPDLSATGGTGKFVSQTSGDAGALFDLIA